MTTPMPAEFVRRMSALLGDEVDLFLQALREPRTRGLRLNPAKASRGQLEALLGTGLSPVPWCPTGFMPQRPTGGHPAHLAGLYYLQEPSAMLVAQALDPQPGWRVADLAAAPGGKTTHLAALLGGTGFVLANEISSSRLRSLHETLDLWGAPNVATSNLRLDALADLGPFDAVVLDAPCSGEGLFRRKLASLRDWSPAAVAGAARRQERLLADAARLVEAGGVMVYSTCTFSREENEDRVAAFLGSHPSWYVERAEVMSTPGVSRGLPSDTASTGDTARLWPHRVVGEGQYVARLRYDEDRHPRHRPRPRRRAVAATDGDVRAAWNAFRQRFLPHMELPAGDVVVRGDTAYLATATIDQTRVARPGLPLGRARPGRFEPAHALATAIRPDAAEMHVRWDTDDGTLYAYLSGHVVESAGSDGWMLVCWRDWPIGWAKRSGNTLKNMLPDHVRRLAAPANKGIPR